MSAQWLDTYAVLMLKPLQGEKVHTRFCEAVLTEITQGLRLCQSPQRDEAESIHELRVLFKRLRAYWQLLAPMVDERVLKSSHHRLRLAAHALAGQRDQAVLLETMTERLLSYPDEPVKGLLALYAEMRRLNETALPQPVAWPLVIAALHLEHSVWQAFCQNLKAKAFRTAVREGLRQTLQRMLNLSRPALDSKRLEPSHLWRKWIKHLFYQSKLLVALHAEPCANRHKLVQLLNQLGEQLGLLHDSALLDDYLCRREAHTRPERRALKVLIHANQSHLQQLRADSDKVFQNWKGRVKKQR